MTVFKFLQLDSDQACTQAHFLWDIINKNVADLLQHSFFIGKQVCSGYSFESIQHFVYRMIAQLPLTHPFYITFLQLLISVIV